MCNSPITDISPAVVAIVDATTAATAGEITYLLKAVHHCANNLTVSRLVRFSVEGSSLFVSLKGESFNFNHLSWVLFYHKEETF